VGLVRRIDQHEAAPLGRRNDGKYALEAVPSMHVHLPIASKRRLERGMGFRMKLEQLETIGLAEQRAGDPRRAGIRFERIPAVARIDDLDIRRELRRHRTLFEHSRDPSLELASALRLR